MKSPEPTTTQGMQCLCGPYRLNNETELKMFVSVCRDLSRPDRHGNKIKWREIATPAGSEIWRKPSPDVIDTHSFASRYRKNP